MGCYTSKSSSKFARKSTSDVYRSSNLSQSEIEMRTEAPQSSENFVHCGISIKYAWASQRGYYPDSPDKDNQDCYTILPSIKMKDGSTTDVALFGVYDGHGTDGHLSSRYARNQLSTNLIGMLMEAPDGGRKATEKAILKAHKTTNESLHASSSIDSSSSGTTSITVLMHGRTMYINNVGDSRAIVISAGDHDSLRVNAMSSDHTPYRKDERFRVMKYGARILSMDQVLQNNVPQDDTWGDITLGDDIDEAGDPPRVWAQHGDYPGTAFTRSFGDKAAELLGVTAEPEILVRDIYSSDKYIIIATDGVFEFMTNQMVADIVTATDDPLDACRAVVAAAYELWLRYDVRTDDITIVILKFGEIPPGVLSPDDITLTSPCSPYGDQLVSRLASSAAIFGSASPPALNPTARVLEDTRPVRRAISREKKKKMVVFMPFINEDEEESHHASSAVFKTERDAQAIAVAMKFNSLFQHLNFTQRCEVVSLMQSREVKEGDWVVTQGDEGDNFYLIDKGRFEVRVKAACSDEQNGGNVVHVYESGRDQHPGFGELALLYGNPRAASVIALTDGNLWFLEHKVFKRLVMRSIDNNKLMQRLLRKVQLFSCFGMDQIRVIVKLLSEEKFLAGEYITREGQRDENFYIIVKGECEYSSKEEHAEGEVEVEGEEKEGEEGSPTREETGTGTGTGTDGGIGSGSGSGSGSCSGSTTLAGGTKSTYLILKKDDHFGERSLLSDRTVSAYSVLAKTDVKVLYVGAKDFENHLGRFSEKVESYKAARDADILSRVSAPGSLSDLTALGLVSSDDVGSVLIGSFGLPPCSVTVRSYLLSKVDQRKASSAILNSIEAFRVINSSTQKNGFVFRLLSFCHDRNALHLILDLPVVADLDSLLTAGNSSSSIRTTEEVVIYVATCVFSGLEFLHSLGIIFRCVQPEAIYVDVHGRVILGSFRVSKVGTVGGKTYTITGTTEYLAPEQVGRQGHSASVDLWSLGVVLYELATGVHPFAAEGDTAFTSYSKISSYGTRAFPRLFYPEDISKELIALIEKLLVPVPEMRLGAGLRGYDAVKEIFNNLDWEDIKSHPPPSPLAASAAVVREDMLMMGVESSHLDAFSEDYCGTDQWQKTVVL